MLPVKVTEGARKLLRRRVARLVRLLNLETHPPALILADAARLVGDAAWLLDPEGIAALEGSRRAIAARKAFGVCIWDGACEADATDEGLCAEHAVQCAKEEAESGDLDDLLAEASKEPAP